jgi:hypothetical protein
VLVDQRTVQYAKLGTFVNKEHHLLQFALLVVIVTADKMNVRPVYRVISVL